MNRMNLISTCVVCSPWVFPSLARCELIKSTGRNEVEIRSPHIEIHEGQVGVYEVPNFLPHPLIFANSEALPQMFWYEG